MKKLMMAALLTTGAMCNAALVVHDFSGDNLDATTTLTGVASSVLEFNRSDLEGVNFNKSFTDTGLADGLVLTRLQGEGNDSHPFGSIGSNGLEGDTNGTQGDFSLMFKYTVTADSGYDLVLNSFTFSKVGLTGGTALRTAMFHDDGETPAQVDDTKSQGNNSDGTFVFTVDGGAYKGGTFDGTIAAGTSETFYIDFGANYNSGASVQGLTDFEFDYAVVAVPEPATLGLVAAMGGGLLFVRRLMI